MVLSGDTVGCQKCDSLLRTEPSVGIGHAREDGVDRVGRQGDQTVRRDLGVVGPPGHEVQARTAGTVAYRDSARELDEVAEGDVVADRDRALLLDDLVEAVAGLEVGLDVGEGHDRAV